MNGGRRDSSVFIDTAVQATYERAVDLKPPRPSSNILSSGVSRTNESSLNRSRLVEETHGAGIGRSSEARDFRSTITNVLGFEQEVSAGGSTEC